MKEDTLENTKEKTLAFIKPDGVKRDLIGRIIDTYEQQGLSVINLKMMFINRKLGERHYQEHKHKDFFEELIEYIISGPSVIIELEGNDAVQKVRRINEAIRDKYGVNKTQNTVHGSDSAESADREIQLFFHQHHL